MHILVQISNKLGDNHSSTLFWIKSLNEKYAKYLRETQKFDKQKFTLDHFENSLFICAYFLDFLTDFEFRICNSTLSWHLKQIRQELKQNNTGFVKKKILEKFRPICWVLSIINRNQQENPKIMHNWINYSLDILHSFLKSFKFLMQNNWEGWLSPGLIKTWTIIQGKRQYFL